MNERVFLIRRPCGHVVGVCVDNAMGNGVALDFMDALRRGNRLSFETITEPVKIGGDCEHGDACRSELLFGPLRVLVTHERDGCFCAQGLEVDYFAQGADLLQVEQHFVRGLVATIAANVARGLLPHFMVPAPRDVWAEFYALETFTLKELPGVIGLPFSSILLVGKLA